MQGSSIMQFAHSVLRNFSFCSQAEPDDLARLVSDWRLARRSVRPASAGASAISSRVLIVAADPWTICGSRGDQAMIETVTHYFRTRDPRAIIAIATDPEVGGPVVTALGHVPFKVWTNPTFVEEVTQSLEAWSPTAVCVLGADVIDGAYGAMAAAKMLIIADLASRRRIPTSILGFSFGTRPSARLRPVFARLHHGVALNVREARSLRRFRAFARRPVQQVADVAFSLPPAAAGPALAQTVGWIEDRRSQGRLVLGINLHPTLLGTGASERTAALIEAMAQSLRFLHDQAPASFLLLAHDFRPEVADDICLGPLAQRLRQCPEIDFHYPAGYPTAAELKSLAGRLDGLIAARMHLIIAGLGGGVPALALCYQDKFEGLLDLFALPGWLAVDPQDALDHAVLTDRIGRFVAALAALRSTIGRQLAQVREASMRNFRAFER